MTPQPLSPPCLTAPAPSGFSSSAPPEGGRAAGRAGQGRAVPCREGAGSSHGRAAGDHAGRPGHRPLHGGAAPRYGAALRWGTGPGGAGCVGTARPGRLGPRRGCGQEAVPAGGLETGRWKRGAGGCLPRGWGQAEPLEHPLTAVRTVSTSPSGKRLCGFLQLA